MSGDVYFNKNAQYDSRTPGTDQFAENGYLERVDALPEDEQDEDNSAGDFGGYTKKKKKKHIFRNFIAAVLILIALCIGLVFAGGKLILKSYQPEELLPNESVSQSSLLHSAGVYNVLLMGVDNMNTVSTSRSDAMILMSIDSRHLELKLTSFMRDSYVNIPGHGWSKLNAACTYGGPQLVVDTIEYNFGVDIDAYCKIGYDMFITLVDGIGGITVSEIDSTEAAALAIEGIFIEPGTDIHLDGKAALHYCRIRKGQSDFARTERQREAITLIIKKALKTNPVKLLSIARDMVGTAQCSVSEGDIMKLALKVLPCVFGDIQSERVPADGTWYNDTRNSQAVLIVDTEKNRDFLNEYIYS